VSSTDKATRVREFSLTDKLCHLDRRIDRSIAFESRRFKLAQSSRDLCSAAAAGSRRSENGEKLAGSVGYVLQAAQTAAAAAAGDVEADIGARMWLLAVEFVANVCESQVPSAWDTFKG
jgi:hypothetical protein